MEPRVANTKLRYEGERFTHLEEIYLFVISSFNTTYIELSIFWVLSLFCKMTIKHSLLLYHFPI